MAYYSTYIPITIRPIRVYNWIVSYFQKSLSFYILGKCNLVFSYIAPGPPSEVNVYAFAKYILVTWQQPLEPNGIITSYRMGSAAHSGSQPNGDVEMEQLGPATRRKLLDEQTPETNFVVEIQAQTSEGWGESVRKTTRTVQWSGKSFVCLKGDV